jgi:hypothetical protein
MRGRRQLLHPSPRVVKEEHHDVIAPPGCGGAVGGRQERLHLVLLQVEDGPHRRPLEWNGADAVAVVRERRLLGSDEGEEAPDRREPVVSRRDLVAPLPFQVVEEVSHGGGVEVGDLETDHGALLALGDEAEQKFRGIAIRQDGQGTHAPLWKGSGEECLDERGQGLGCHDRLLGAQARS